MVIRIERRYEGTSAVEPAMRKQPGRLVFIDETSVKTNMCRLRGNAFKGERPKGQAPLGKWNTQTFIAGLRCHELTAPWVIDGAMNREAFDTYLETRLVLTLSKGDVVILDNLNVHKSPRAEQALAARGAWFLCPPIYSPDLNPIDRALLKLKAHMQKLAARTYDELWKSIGAICNLFPPRQCWNFFKAMHYVAD